jgi:mannitol-1-phosphate 5-dehydrogenase
MSANTPKTLVQFGAGNIGRSLVAPLFTRAGYTVVFIDPVRAIVDALNARGGYSVVVKDDLPPGTPDAFAVTNVRAIDAANLPAVRAALATCSMASTAVGAAILPQLAPLFAAVLRLRTQPLNVLLCENLRNAAAILRAAVAAQAPALADTTRLGLIETSIGKMVPLMPPAVRAQDPLLVWAEAYNQIIADADGFIGAPPVVAGLVVKRPFAAFVDRKLFIHNLGHAAAAYFGHLRGLRYMWECMADAAVQAQVAQVMQAAAQALLKRYPGVFTTADLDAHVADLLHRFANRALGDTVYRVGRDLPRKLAPDDRCIGALRLVQETGGDPAPVLAVLRAALQFAARDEHDRLFPADAEFHAYLAAHGVAATLAHYCGLDSAHD